MYSSCLWDINYDLIIILADHLLVTITNSKNC